MGTESMLPKIQSQLQENPRKILGFGIIPASSSQSQHLHTLTDSLSHAAFHSDNPDR